MTRSKRIYVLDTNVLMHDPTALFKFEEHDIYLPMMVLEELDNAKKGTSEVSRNARQVSRFLNELIESNGADKIADGLRLVRPQGLQLRETEKIGKLHFQTGALGTQRKPGNPLPDNQILAAILTLREENVGVPVVLVSKDINLRIKAHIVGVAAEDYENDRALDDFNLLYTGATELPLSLIVSRTKAPELKEWLGTAAV
jgi:PhoH-like ATPase